MPDMLPPKPVQPPRGKLLIDPRYKEVIDLLIVPIVRQQPMDAAMLTADLAAAVLCEAVPIEQRHQLMELMIQRLIVNTTAYSTRERIDALPDDVNHL